MERRMRKVVSSREKMSGANHFFFLGCLVVSIGEMEREVLGLKMVPRERKRGERKRELSWCFLTTRRDRN